MCFTPPTTPPPLPAPRGEKHVWVGVYAHAPLILFLWCVLRIACACACWHAFLTVGGALGATREEMLSLLTPIVDTLPPLHPRHLLGIGDPESLQQVFSYGIDTCDSSYPTRAARQ
jgi:Queuine tRNA-ribosyltransferase